MEEAARRLSAAQVEIPRRTAEWLWMHAAGVAKHELLLHWRDEADPAAVSAFLVCVGRRCAREPLQYILGEADFAGLNLDVDRRVLIPRPETELLVNAALTQIVAMCRRTPSASRLTVVDLGTGSGAIAIALAKGLARQGLLPQIRLLATDLSAEALDVARSNALRCGVSDVIEFLQGDALLPAAFAAGTVAGLVANPPYIPESAATQLEPEVRNFEPAAALYGGRDGLDMYRRIVSQAVARLADDAFIAFEVGIHQAEAVSGLIRSAFPVADVECIPDAQGILRVVVARPPVRDARSHGVAASDHSCLLLDFIPLIGGAPSDPGI